MTQKMLTVKEVAERISVSEWSIRQWVNKGKVPGATKFGNAIRIPESFVTGGTAEDRIREEHEVQPLPKGLDADPRDEWPVVEAPETLETPEPIAPPTDENEEI